MIELKEHNRRPYADLCRALEKNDRVAYVSATGTGKSYVGGKYVEEHDGAEKTLILVPSNVIRNGWKKILPKANVISYQAMIKNKRALSGCDLIICDEMHHLGAAVWGKHYKEMLEGYKGKIIGMTATPVRFLDDSRDMVDELFEGNQVIGTELPEAIQEGVLPTFTYVTALFSAPRPKKCERGGELSEQLYKKLDALENKYSFQAIMAKYMKQEQHKVVVFVPSIGEIDLYKNVIKDLYGDALHLVAHSKMPKRKVTEAIYTFESTSQTAFIYTVDLLNEGIHIEDVDSVIMFRKTESPTVFLQQLGRALTSSQASERITVFDFVANYRSIKGKHDGAETVIDWITERVGDGERQVIRDDCAREQQEVLDRLMDLLHGRWTAEEIEIMKAYYDEGKGIDKILELLPHRKRSSIISFAIKLGLSRPYPGRWSKEEDEILQRNQESSPSQLRASLPGRTADAIRARRVALHLPSFGAAREVWTNKALLS